MDPRNKKFAELCGICWHEDEWINHKYICKKCKASLSDSLPGMWNPDFVIHPTLVLREMMKRDDWYDFSHSLWVETFSEVTTSKLSINYQVEFMIERSIPNRYILDTTEGRLLDAAIKFMEEKQ